MMAFTIREKHQTADGVRIENVLGDYGVGLAIEEIFESY